jgi:hypothetical protein
MRERKKMLVNKEDLFKNRKHFSSVRLNSQEQYMLGTLVKMGTVPTQLHERLIQTMNEMNVNPVAREVAEIFMGIRQLPQATDAAHDLYTHMRIWAGKEDRIPA